MSFDSGPLDRFLHSAVGDDPAVAAELHATFVHSANELADLLQRARCDANWSMAALRLKSLSATFGVIPLIELAEQAMAGAPGDPAVVRDIRSVITALN
jgi:hypothetical protein